jgi:hypothetical protein
MLVPGTVVAESRVTTGYILSLNDEKLSHEPIETAECLVLWGREWTVCETNCAG